MLGQIFNFKMLVKVFFHWGHAFGWPRGHEDAGYQNARAEFLAWLQLSTNVNPGRQQYSLSNWGPAAQQQTWIELSALGLSLAHSQELWTFGHIHSVSLILSLSFGSTFILSLSLCLSSKNYFRKSFLWSLNTNIYSGPTTWRNSIPKKIILQCPN